MICLAQSGVRLGAHDDEVLCLAFSTDGKVLASGSKDGYVKTWDLATRTNARERYLSGGATTCLAYSPDGKSLAVGKERARVMMVDVAEFEAWKVLDGLDGPARALAASPDGQKVYLVAERDPRLYVWQPSNRTPLEKHEHESEVLAFVLSPDGKRMATAVASGRVRVFSTQPVERQLQVDYVGTPACLAFSPDGTRLACGGAGGVRLWNVATGRPAGGFAPVGGPATCLAFTPSGDRLAVGTEAGPILLIDARTGAQAAKLEGHGKAVTTVAFSKDGKTLASGGRDRSVRLWPIG